MCSFRGRVACGDNKHFQSVLVSPGELSGIWVGGCTWGMTETQIINTHLLSKLLFKNLLNDHNKSLYIHMRFNLYFQDRFVAVGKVGDDRRNTLWDSVHTMRQYHIISPSHPSPLFLIPLSPTPHGAETVGWQGELRTSDKLRNKNMSASGTIISLSADF